MTLAAFFVSAFITVKAATGLRPLQGWTQFIMPFETKEECEHFEKMLMGIVKKYDVNA